MVYILIQKGITLATTIVTLILFGTSLFLIKRKIKEVKSYKHLNYETWGRGAGAELVEANYLEHLPGTYKVIPDLDSGHGNIDFVIIGSTGILCMEVKAEKGQISSNRERLFINNKWEVTEFIDQTYAEKKALETILINQFNTVYPITCLLEFAYATIDKTTINHPIKGVWVGSKKFHEYLLNNSNNCLTNQEIDKIANYLERVKNSQKV